MFFHLYMQHTLKSKQVLSRYRGIHMEEWYNKTEPQMLFKKTIQKTKNFLHRTPHNIKSFLFGGYHKPPKARQFNPFFSSSKRVTKSTIQELDDLYRDYYQQKHQPDHKEISERNNTGKYATKYQGMVEGEGSESQRKFAVRFGTNDIERERRKNEKKTDKYDEMKRPKAFTRSTSNGDRALLQKLEELEMIDDAEDVEHVLDLDEVLHHYSLLTSPVYRDIVDRFFMDMYTEFSVPKPSVSVNSSMRRLGPLKL